ncbi:MAG: ATP-binding protein [Succiniclasticum sp.]|jgi:DNA polymerase-3 subunit delta'
MFETITGHEENKEFLRRLLQRDRRPHSLLFHGPEGMGKRLLALEFAKALLCLTPAPDGSPCGTCASCRLLHSIGTDTPLVTHGGDTEGPSHPDFLYLEHDHNPEKKRRLITINQIHELISLAQLAPTVSRRRVCLVDEADLMTTEAANAFLKLLEEPPPHFYFLLIAAKADAMLPTILSRVIRLRFAALSPDEVCRILRQKTGLGEDEAQVVARLADGSLGRALAYCETGILELRTAALEYISTFPTATPLHFIMGRDYFSDLIPDGSPASFETLRTFLDLVRTLLRDLLFLQAGLTDRLLNKDCSDTLVPLSRKWERTALLRASAAVDRASWAASKHANRKAVLDDLTYTLNAAAQGAMV